MLNEGPQALSAALSSPAETERDTRVRKQNTQTTEFEMTHAHV